MTSQLHQISFVYDNQRHQFNLRLNQAQAEDLDNAIRLDIGDEDDVKDIQVYEISENLAGGSAEAIVDIIGSNQEIDEAEAFEHLMTLAQHVDAAADQENAILEHVLVEFIWDTGGVDDNAFGQSMTVNTNAPDLNAQFFKALRNYLDLGVAYDFSTMTEREYADMEACTEDALSSTIERLENLFERVPGRIQSILDSLKLDKATPTAATTLKSPRL